MVISPLWRLLRTFSWQELRHHGARHLAAIVAVTLGVALAFSVHLINDSALVEFDAAVRSVSGEADFNVHAAQGALDEGLFASLAQHPDVAAVSPVIDVHTQVQGRPLRVLGIDPLRARPMTPALVAQVSRDVIGNDRLTLFDPKVIFLNAQAQRALEVVPGSELTLQAGLRTVTLRVAGTVAASGEALAVMDIAGAQTTFGLLGKLSRIDVKLREGVQAKAFKAGLSLPRGLLVDSPEDAVSQASQMSRAYRVNLTVLALIALFTGAFLVFSTLSLSVARRQRQFALLGVLGLSARERLTLVLLETSVMGTVGAALGIALGGVLAVLALNMVGADLGGDYFANTAPALHWSWSGAALYGLLGVLTAMGAGVMPARMAQRLAPAQALKSDQVGEAAGLSAWWGPALLLMAAGLSFAPPLDGVPWGAYLAIACLMVGGIRCVPAVVSVGLRLVKALMPRAYLGRRAPLLLSLERVRRMRQAATVAIAGVVVSLGLSVALTVMVGSFRGSIVHWLDTLLPADLYVRTGAAVQGNDALFFDHALLEAMPTVPGVARWMGVRVSKLNLQAGRAAVVLIARPLGGSVAERQTTLPLVGAESAPAPGQVGIFVSEVMASLYGLHAGSSVALPLVAGQAPVLTHVQGVWRDYAHQQGAFIMDAPDYQRITGDKAINDLALWLKPGVTLQAVEEGIRQVATAHQLDGQLLSFSEPADIRASTLKVFDRSFAVTVWLQGVALAIGLFGVSASFSSQILARRKEFGLLCHLGFTRQQMLWVLAGEGAVLTSVGALLGLGLGWLVSLILVDVVNPQSFHWRMDMRLPWPQLVGMCLGMVLAGTATAWAAGRSAFGADVVRAVKEDW